MPQVNSFSWTFLSFSYLLMIFILYIYLSSFNNLKNNFYLNYKSILNYNILI